VSRHEEERLLLGGLGGAAERVGVWRLRLIALAVVALVLGVVGSASATLLVGSRQVKDGSLRGRDLALGTIRGSDVRDHSLQPQDFGILPKGPVGPTGDTGARGIAGTPGVSYANQTVTVAHGDTATFELLCTPPQRAVFGGSGALPTMDLLQSAPEVDGSAWVVVLRNRDTVDDAISVFAVCVTDR
jgi:hypothetical protein